MVTTMSTVSVALIIALAVVAIALIVVVLLQSNRAAGLGAVGGSGNGGNDSYWSKNKGNSVEGALSKYTKILGALFMIIALAVNFLA